MYKHVYISSHVYTAKKTDPCGSVPEIFPEVNLGFVGGASMAIKPQAYLFQMFLDDVSLFHMLKIFTGTKKMIFISVYLLLSSVSKYNILHCFPARDESSYNNSWR